MKTAENGYVIICEDHPVTGTSYIVHGSFQNYKHLAIAYFIKDTSHTWEYWKRKYNFRCVKATQSINLLK